MFIYFRSRSKSKDYLKSHLFILFNLASIIIYGQNKSVAFDGKPEKLRGEWRLIMNSFQDYDDLKKDSTSISVKVPGTWNNLTWKNKKIGPFGYGTFFKKIIIDSSTKSEKLSISVSEISLAYRLFIDNQFLGSVGNPAKSEYEEVGVLDAETFDFEVTPGDTIMLIFHVSNFHHESGGIWYEPTIGYSSEIRRDDLLTSSLKLIILGCVLIIALFELFLFIKRPSEKFSLYFFVVCISLGLLLLTRGKIPLMDLFPNTPWNTLKKLLYVSIVLIGPSNALFLREIFPKFFHKRVVDTISIIALGLSIYIIVVSPRVSYPIIPIHHIYNVVIGLYLLICLIKAALNNEYGAKYLLIGYLAAFLAVLHDILTSQYVIEGYRFSMIYVGIFFYILQLLFLIIGRYLFALEGKDELSNHLKKVNSKLEEIVKGRTKALEDKSRIIEAKNLELEKAIKEKDHLMAVVAHDLKAPLANILGISEMMESDLKGKSAQFNEMIQKVTNDGRELIENLTELRVYEQDDFEVKPIQFNLNDFVDQKKIIFKQQAEKKNIKLNSHLTTNQSEIISDPSILGRIIDNLLSNAIKFSSKGGRVDFNIKVLNSLKIEVIDNGPGFSERDKEKVFKKFQRLSARPTAGESSAGLGLSIVKTLVTLLDGSVELKSEKDNGATFIVTIPIDQ